MFCQSYVSIFCLHSDDSTDTVFIHLKKFQCFLYIPDITLIMRKPVYATCKQQRRRSAQASMQSDQHLCCSLPRSYNISSFYIRNFKPLPTFCGCAGRFESTLVANPEDRFSRDEAHILLTFFIVSGSCRACTTVSGTCSCTTVSAGVSARKIVNKTGC